MAGSSAATSRLRARRPVACEYICALLADRHQLNIVGSPSSSTRTVAMPMTRTTRCTTSALAARTCSRLRYVHCTIPYRACLTRTSGPARRRLLPGASTLVVREAVREAVRERARERAMVAVTAVTESALAAASAPRVVVADLLALAVVRTRRARTTFAPAVSATTIVVTATVLGALMAIAR
jgi:hypothetical protein